MRFRTRNIIKKASLILLGIGIIGVIGIGTKKLVDYTKNDTKTLHLNYEVGNLGTDGKYVNDELALYSNKFACEGLRVSFDFDAEVNGQFAFYDINDKYLSKTEVITEGTSVDIPLNGAYARAVVIPTNDEDEKISFTEKYKYGSQMQVKVNKKAEANINKRFTDYNGLLMEVVNNIEDLNFQYNLTLDSKTGNWVKDYDNWYATSTTILDLNGFKKISFDFSSYSSLEDTNINVETYFFNDIPKTGTTYKRLVLNHSKTGSFEIPKGYKYVIISGSFDTDGTTIPSTSIKDLFILS